MAVIDQVVMLFLIILVGLASRKKNMLTDETIRGVTLLTVHVAVPALSIVNFQRTFSPEILGGIVLTFFASAALMLLFLALAHFLFRKKSAARRAVLTHLFSFSNCGFMGYPLILSISPDFFIYAIAFNASFNLLCWTLGCALFQQSSGALDWKRAVLSPAVLAIVVGLTLFCAQIRLPAFLCDTLNMLGSLTTPLSMLLIGSRMAGLRLRDFADRDYHLGAFMRLAVSPLLCAALLSPFHLPQPVFVTVVLLMAMPGASVAVMQAELYGGDYPFAARAVAYSTLLSLVTIPLVTLILL